tara:strand:+ start:1445 stop:1606 length:162 start_codon:yes stop_codon:yes gene_type:complete
MKVIKNKIAVDPKSGCNNNTKADKENIITGIRKTLILERTFLLVSRYAHSHTI